MLNGENVYGQAFMHLANDMTQFCSGSAEPEAGKPRKTRIVCTMGPSCWDVDTLVQMLDIGMNVARLNFSHGDHDAHGATVGRIRDAMKQRPDKNCAILLDTKGPEIRSGFFAAGGNVELKQGQDLKIVTDYSFKGDENCIACTYEKLPTSVSPGDTILMADGSVSLKVKECGADFVMTTVMNNAKIGERKNMNLPGIKVDLPVLGEKDKNDLVNFGIPQKVNFVAASFVQSADDVRQIREVLGEAGKNIKIISKIENMEGLKNFDDILEETDGVMVARGDLGMEIPVEKVFLAQKMMIAKCHLKGKPVITATQMLESMTKAPRATRAEASDVANAVLDGSDAVMLSGETAGGQFPLLALRTMSNVCAQAEEHIAYNLWQRHLQQNTLDSGAMTLTESVACSAVNSATSSNAKVIVCVTETGTAARFLSKYRPSQPILAICLTHHATAHLQVVQGVVAMEMQGSISHGVDSAIREALNRAKNMGLVKEGDLAVCVQGQGTAKAQGHGKTDMFKIVSVE